MAHGTKYFFRFESQNGTEYRIELKEKDYTGPAIQRALGAAPVLKQERSGRVLGGSLELFLECLQDQEFAELYNPEANHWRAEVYAFLNPASATPALIWDGYVTPELYSEPDLYPPYDVQVVATDGLGELKFQKFDPDAVTPDSTTPANGFASILRYLLDLSGMPWSDADTTAVPFILSTLRVQNEGSSSSLTGTFRRFCASLEAFRDRTCYEVLNALLDALNTYIFRKEGRWHFVRPTDLALTEEGRVSSAYYWIGPSVPERSHPTFTKLSAGWWPVGHLSTTIHPARKSVTVTVENLYKDGINPDPDMDQDDSWTKSGAFARYILNRGQEGEDYGFTIGNGFHAYGSLSQSFAVAEIGASLELVLHALSFNPSGWTEPAHVRLMVKNTDASGTRYLTKSAASSEIYGDRYTWHDSAGYIELPLSPRDQTPGERNSPEELVLNFYGLNAGTLEIQIYNNSYDFVYVGGFWIRADLSNRPQGLRSVVLIDNGARTDAEAQAVFGTTGAASYITLADSAITSAAGGPIAKLSNGRYEASRSLEFIALDNAYAVALPRLRLTGTVNTPARARRPIGFIKSLFGTPADPVVENTETPEFSETINPDIFDPSQTVDPGTLEPSGPEIAEDEPPTLQPIQTNSATSSSIAYFVEAFTWDLANDELEFEALSLPSSDIQISGFSVRTTENR